MKNYLKFILFILPFSFWSCTQEKYLDEINKSYLFSIQDAKQWYETQLLTKSIRSQQKVKGEGMDIQIQPHLSWEKAVLGNDSLWTVVELPWEYLNGSLVIAKSEVKQYSESKNIQPQQILKLVIIRNRKNRKNVWF